MTMSLHELAFWLVVFGGLCVLVVWCGFGVWFYVQQERMWRQLRRGRR